MRVRNERKKQGKGGGIGIVVCIAVVAIFFLTMSYENEKEPANVAGAEETVRYIQKKVSATQVISRFSPALLYREKESSPLEFVGSGSVFIGGEGEQVVTVEHLLSLESGRKSYAAKRLRSGKDDVQAIEKILHTGMELSGDMTDVVILKTGVSKPIMGFSVHTSGIGAQVETRITPNLIYATLTSLVSGERVRLLGQTTDPLGTKITYLLIDYESVSGESGAGFVDDEDRLYVLRGGSDDYGPEDFSILGKFRAVSIVYGPVAIP